MKTIDKENEGYLALLNLRKQVTSVLSRYNKYEIDINEDIADKLMDIEDALNKELDALEGDTYWEAV